MSVGIKTGSRFRKDTFRRTTNTSASQLIMEHHGAKSEK